MAYDKQCHLFIKRAVKAPKVGPSVALWCLLCPFFGSFFLCHMTLLLFFESITYTAPFRPLNSLSASVAGSPKGHLLMGSSDPSSVSSELVPFFTLLLYFLLTLVAFFPLNCLFSDIVFIYLSVCDLAPTLAPSQSIKGILSRKRAVWLPIFLQYFIR